jgi:hypothetical protein
MQGLLTLLTFLSPFITTQKKLFKKYKDIPDEEALVFIKSWNEWGEGNYMEPDRRYGRGYIEELCKAIKDA